MNDNYKNNRKIKVRLPMMMDFEVPGCTWEEEVSEKEFESLKPLQNEYGEIVLGGRNLATYLMSNYSE